MPKWGGPPGPRRAPWPASSRAGQATLEFALIYIGIFVPLTFGIVFLSQMLWVWHSVIEFTRDGARYAATHCYQGDFQNVIGYMQSHVPRMIDQQQFKEGQATIQVDYFAKDPSTGQLSPFTCNGDCTVDCEPDAVTVSIPNYQFTHFVNFLKLPPVSIPTFPASLPMESVGCDPVQGSCLP